jgi:hypothetical protein
LARDIRSIGFRTADQIAAKLGIEKTRVPGSPTRSPRRWTRGIGGAVIADDLDGRNDDPQEPGSEYPAVVIPLTTQHYMMLQRNLIYTGVTRGKRLVVLVGQRKALAIAVKGGRVRRRWSQRAGS